jgi:hypothetical protein
MADTVKHTAGPWAISGRSAACIRTADQDQRIAYLETADNTFEVCEANALLIAAAPDLLEHGGKLASEVAGLKAFEQDIRAVIGNTNWSVLMDRLVGVENAIARAEGRS